MGTSDVMGSPARCTWYATVVARAWARPRGKRVNFKRGRSILAGKARGCDGDGKKGPCGSRVQCAVRRRTGPASLGSQEPADAQSQSHRQAVASCKLL